MPNLIALGLKNSAKSLTALVSLACFALISIPAKAETLLIKSADGYEKAAASYTVVTHGENAKVQLKAEHGFDLPNCLAAIREKLPNAEVSSHDDVIVVSGYSEAELLDKLASVNVGGGQMLAMEQPEGGGSIRVGKTMEIPGATPASNESAASPTASKERFKATVVSREGEFPSPTLKLKLLATPHLSATDPLKKLHKGTVIAAKMVFAMKGDALDVDNAQTQANLLANYLRAGDEVWFTVAPPSGDQYVLAHIERAR